MDRAVSSKRVNSLLTKTSARGVALATLIRVLKTGAYSNISLDQHLRRAGLSRVDEKLATKLVYGTIQYKIYLTYQLQGLLKSKIKEDYIKPLLLMSAYQLFFLDKIPARAVLDEANKLAKAFGRKGSAGFRLVNGILRALARRGAIIPAKNDLVSYLSIKESFPVWLVQYFIRNWGSQRAERLLHGFNQTPKNCVRVSALADLGQVKAQLRELGFAPQASHLSAENLLLRRGGAAATPLFKKGQITIQDEAASLPVAAFTFSGNEQVLDACSAPGGKTVQIAEQLTMGKVTALDIHPRKLRLVRQNAARMHVLSKVTTKALDARKADDYFSAGQFARILVDAPCSGLGLLRRKPEIRYTKKPADVMRLQQIQLAILDHVSPLLARQGELIYSTCTLTHEEDEDVVALFLKGHPEFQLTPFALAEVASKTGQLKILPDQVGSDGFFIAKFKLRG